MTKGEKAEQNERRRNEWRSVSINSVQFMSDSCKNPFYRKRNMLYSIYTSLCEKESKIMSAKFVFVEKEYIK